MLRSFVVLGFLSLLAVTGWIFYVRPASTLRQQIIKPQAGRRILLLENFVLFRHAGGAQVIGRVSGDRGEFYAPNRIEVHGNVRAWRLVNDHDESLQSEVGRAWILRTGSRPFGGDAALERAEVEKKVVVSRENYTLTTEQAEYHAKNQRIVGHVPVQ